MNASQTSKIAAAVILVMEFSVLSPIRGPFCKLHNLPQIVILTNYHSGLSSAWTVMPKADKWILTKIGNHSVQTLIITSAFPELYDLS